ncbi:DNA topoisomerase 2-binding protein 1-A [Psilocybe cubensis]|uniref:DNA topoisomerase 2-binding protein 1-A n=1 Tax=Psilocybe cubensis TaxID=181762 RepID=A0ACB8H2H3_PSICU|nr:DNA topoisomerase 2-binding protein 1-A [Psilocybe cubensis]KAH9481897.1 DNA topoisomerase 2-binding protein 1-A [Psilocybe cubensis]
MSKRRGNKSTKVPGVKLRPAEKGAYSRPVEESCWAQDSQDGSEDTSFYDSCPRPLKGMSICATGVPDKPTLFKQAVELGATCTPAFTDRVTHLVAIDHGSAKYMCALERKIPIVTPSWITENYKIWLKGDDVDVVKSVEQHRLPIFSGVVICPSGITDITRRTQISKLVQAHQGEYLKNLERPVRVTHLLCSGDEETEKMKYAEKFNSRGEAKIHLVWEEWFWDSIDFGGRFDEAKYQVSLPRPERKALQRSSPPPPTSFDVPSQHDEIPSSSVASRQPQVKNMEEAEDEPAFVNVLPAVTLQLWGSLLERRGYEITDGEVILSPSKGLGKRKASEELQPPSPVKFGAARSVISSFRRANSFAPAVPNAKAGPSRQLPFRRTSTAMAIMGDNNASTSALPDPTTPQASQIFLGMKLRILGEARGSKVREAIEKLGGTISVDEEEDVDFIIVRLVTGSKLYRDEEDESLRAKFRTECWLEQCIYEDRICGPHEHISSVPIATQIPIPGAEKIRIALSGFDQSEACGLARFFKATGITFVPQFNKTSTHLLCPAGKGHKFDKAIERNIPVIGLEWLRAFASTGVAPGPNEYLIAGPPQPAAEDGQPMDIDVLPMDVKGKGKAKVDKQAASDAMDVEVENIMMMQDITNESPPEHNGPTSKKKTKPLERIATVVISTPEPPARMSFGQPNESLGGPAPVSHPSSIPTPGETILSPLAQGLLQEQGSETSLPHLSRRPSSNLNVNHDTDSNPNSHPQRVLQLQKTISVLDVTDKVGRVPSSTSPSPMKIPRNQGSRSSLSPVKIDHQATRALQESITSLLGKRASPDGEGAGGTAAVGPEMVGAAGPRSGKRQRPQRSKPQSRQPSGDAEPQPAAPAPATRVRTRSSRHSQASAFGDTHSPFESYPDSIDLNTRGESVRVMYEDPGQKEEQKRLMSLLKNQPAAAEDDSISNISISASNISVSSRRGTRRSTKIGVEFV